MNKFLTAAFFLLLTLHVNSQTIKSWGVKGGITVSEFSEWSPADSTLKKLYTKEPLSRILVNIALFAEGLSTKHFSTVGEIAYNPKGTSFRYPKINQYGTAFGEESIDNSNGYLSVTLTEKARVGWNSMNFYIYAGPRIDMELSNSSDIDFSPTYNKFSRLIPGLSTGFGVEFYDKRFKILLELQYEPDLGYTLNSAYGRVKKNTWVARIGVGLIAKK